MQVPATARIVIIGGGVIGCSIAYHLAKRGVRDVVVLERLQLTHGATWHAAGLVGQLRSSSNLTRLMRYGAELYGTLEAETGQATGWHRVGSLRLASSAARWQELKRSATMAKGFGFHVELVSPAEASAKFPLLDAKGVVGAAWIEGDGYVDPTSLTNAYAAGARAGGVAFVQGVRVTGMTRVGRRVTTVRHRRRRHRGRMRDRRRRHVGARDRRDGRHARAGLRRRAPVFRHREVRPDRRRAAHAARSRRQFLRQARARRAGRRRLGDEPAAVGRGRHPRGLRARAAAARFRALRADRRGGRRAHTAVERGRHPADDHRADPDHRRRRAGHRALAGARQLLPLLRLHVGHRGLGRRGLGDGQLDRRRRPRHGPVALRRPPLRHAAFGEGIHVRSAPSRATRATTTSRGPATRPTRDATAGAARCTRR